MLHWQKKQQRVSRNVRQRETKSELRQSMRQIQNGIRAVSRNHPPTLSAPTIQRGRG